MMQRQCTPSVELPNKALNPTGLRPAVNAKRQPDWKMRKVAVLREPRDEVRSYVLCEADGGV